MGAKDRQHERIGLGFSRGVCTVSGSLRINIRPSRSPRKRQHRDDAIGGPGGRRLPLGRRCGVCNSQTPDEFSASMILAASAFNVQHSLPGQCPNSAGRQVLRARWTEYDPRNLSRVFYQDKDDHYWAALSRFAVA
jgi:hypothetical protein